MLFDASAKGLFIDACCATAILHLDASRGRYWMQSISRGDEEDCRVI